MPVKDGFQASQEISEFYRNNLINDYRIVAHTAFWDENAQIKSKKCGMVDYIPKPLNFELLNRQLVKVFKVHSKKYSKYRI